VPEQQTDFILSLLGEELGFVGTALVLFLCAVILLCGVRIAWKIADPFGQLLAFGISLLIGVQAFINIGVVTSSLPNKGIALPFVSYGGSSTVCMLTCLGLLISVARHGPLPARNPANQPVSPQPTHRPIGPVGSLLDSSLAPRRANLWHTLARLARCIRRRRFPATPIHPYQKPPSVFPAAKTSQS